VALSQKWLESWNVLETVKKILKMQNGSKDGTVCGTVRKWDKFLERFERWNTSFLKNH